MLTIGVVWAEDANRSSLFHWATLLDGLVFLIQCRVVRDRERSLT